VLDKQQRLYFLPLPQGQGSFLPTFSRDCVCMIASLEYFAVLGGVWKSWTPAFVIASAKRPDPLSDQ
jgi:hypothetical protein